MRILSSLSGVKAAFDPAHTGELIRETIEGLKEETRKGFTVEQIATSLQTTRKTRSAIINGKQSVPPEMALKLGKGFQIFPRAFPNLLMAQGTFGYLRIKIRILNLHSFHITEEILALMT